nr:DNA-directed DNA polymerase [Tanacetum cinerariifolium]
MQTQGQNMQNQLTNLTELLTKFVNSYSASTLSSGTLPSNTIANPRSDLNYESLILNSEPVNSLIIEPVASPVSAPRPNQIPSIPYASRLQDRKLRDKANDQREKFFQIFKDLNFNISFADALILMPKFGPSIKSLLTNKDKLCELAKTPLNEHCLAVLLKKLLEKLGDPGKFLIPCDFPEKAECLALADLGASINLMPLFRSFLKTERALIDVFEGELTLRVGNKAEVLEVDAFLALEDDPTSPKVDQSYLDSERDILLLKAFLNDDPSLPSPNQGSYLPEVRKELKICEAKSDKSSIDEPPEVELKDLPPHLEYAFLEGDKKFPVIIAKDLSVEEKTVLITILKSHKRAIAWKLSDIKAIDPEFCTHKILMEEDFEPAVQHQRRVNPKIHDVIKQEVLKILDAGLIYLISDSPWEKTAFTCQYRTFAYSRMPFGLCNAPGTFQRCMMVIFHDMIEKTMEVFMDDFSVFENSFQSCLSYLEKMLKRCKDTNLCLNGDKSHLMVKEGIVLGHKISKEGIDVDKAKVDVITKLCPPTTIKALELMLPWILKKNTKCLMLLVKNLVLPSKVAAVGLVLLKDELMLEVILNGDSHVPTQIVEGVLQPVAPITTEQQLARKNELKAHGTLLIALPDKHQLKFNFHKDAKTLMEAIEKRFDGNTKTKEVQKTLLKQQFENFTAAASLNSFNSSLAVKSYEAGVQLMSIICSNDLIPRKNELKARGTLLIALPDKHQLKFNFHKDAKTLMEAIEKRFGGNTKTKKVQKSLLKQQFENFTGTASQNLAFMSSTHTDSTIDSVSAVVSVSAACVKLLASLLPNVDSLSRNFGANGPTSMGFDMSKVECYNCHRKGHFARESRSPKDPKRPGAAEPQRRTVPVENSTSNALVSQCDGTGSYDYSYQAEKEPANFALMAFSSNSSSDNETGLESVEARLLLQIHLWEVLVDQRTLDETLFVLVRENSAHLLITWNAQRSQERLQDLEKGLRFQPSGEYHAVPPPYTGTFMPPKLDLVFNTAPTAIETEHLTFNVQLSPTKTEQDLSYTTRPSVPIIEDWVSDSEEEFETKAPQFVPSFVQSSEHVKTPRHSVQQIKTTIPAATSVPASPKSNSSGKRRNRKACFVCK